MKRFSLNKKRVSKVLALALVAAMVVPGVPAQKAVAEDDGSEVTLPDPIATVNFASGDAYDVSDSTTGKQLKFTTTTADSVWKYAEADTTADSVDFIPEMKDGKDALKDSDKYSEANYVWEDIDVAPTTVEVTGDAVSGTALSLKGTVDTTTYPTASKNSDNVTAIQRAKRYSSGVKVANPFANSTKLYDADRYSFAKVADTATEVTLPTPAAVVNRSLSEDESAFTSQKTETGVTISFWAQTPMGDKQLAPTNYFEFYNDSNLVYHNDDLAKLWGGYLVKNATAGAVTKSGSITYRGEVVEADLALVGTGNGDKKLYNGAYGERVNTTEHPKGAGWLGETTDQVKTQFYDMTTGTAVKVKYVKNYGGLGIFCKDSVKYYKEQGAYMITGTQKVTDDGEEVEANTGTVFVLTWVGTAKDIEAEFAKENWIPVSNWIFVKSGEKDDAGFDILYGLQKSWEMITDEEYWEQSNALNGSRDCIEIGEVPTEEISKLDASSRIRYKTDATGVLYVGQAEKNRIDTGYSSDMAVKQNDLGSNSNSDGYTGKYKEKAKDNILTGPITGGDSMGIQYDGTEVTPAEWHYYTVTITDAWVQVYVDGEAYDISAAENAVWANKNFNLGSGLYDPINNLVVNNNASKAYNAYRLYSKDITKNYNSWTVESYGYGYALGATMMKLITNPNTELYIGGKTRETAEGTLIADVDFYDEPLTPEQAAALYEKVTSGEDDDPKPPTPTNALGNVTGDTDKDGNPIINSQDALAVLQYSVGLIEAGEGFDLSAANVNGDVDKTTGEPIINSQDALEILQFSVGLIDHFSAEDAE